MAAPEYYYNSRPDVYRRPQSARRSSSNRSKPDLNAPLPPLPMQTTEGKTIHDPYHPSFRSPFADDPYPTPPQPSQQSPTLDAAYRGTWRTPSDPFADEAAIQLESHQSHRASSTNPLVYNHEDGADPLPQRTSSPSKKKSRWANVPWVVYVLTTIQIVVFIVEIIKNSILTKSPIMIKPSFNPMIGPSTYVLINMGARYVPCMRNTDKVQNNPEPIAWPCPNITTGPPVCTLSDLCGFSGVPNPTPGGSIVDSPAPDQWFRFILPIFLHAGIIHIGFNMLLQLTLGKDMERTIGSLRFFFVYSASGIFGFVMGGVYAPSGIASTGASACIFGILALVLLDLLYTWDERRNPKKDLMFIAIDVLISFALGLLPGLDNFAHIGGFLMGLALGLCILHSPNKLRERVGLDKQPYDPLLGERQPCEVDGQGFRSFIKNPFGFFKGRKPLWWAWWLIRAGSLVAVLIGFIVLLNNFYMHQNNCSWCKYLSCIPVNGWCELGSLTFTKPDRQR